MSLIPQRSHGPSLNNSFCQQLHVLFNNQTILKGWWKSFPQESPSILLPALPFCLTLFCFLTLCYMISSCSSYQTSFPFHQLWSLSDSSLTCFNYLNLQEKKSQENNLHTHIVLSSYQVSELHRLPKGCAKCKTHAMKCPEHVASK